MIDLFLAEFDTWRLALHPGVTSIARELDRPSGVGRAARLDVESGVRLVQVTVWDSGEADFVVGDLSMGDIVVNEHLEVTSRWGVAGLLADVSEAIS